MSTTKDKSHADDMQAIREALSAINSISQQLEREGTVAEWVTETLTKEVVSATSLLDKIDKSGEGEVLGWMDEDSHYSAYKHPAYPIPLVRQSAPAKAPAEVAPSPQAVTVEGKWVSVDERLPELKYLVDQEGGRRSDAVLVYPNGRLGSVAYCYQKPGFDPRWYAIISVPAGEVTHWMPLPSAPASTNT